MKNGFVSRVWMGSLLAAMVAGSAFAGDVNLPPTMVGKVRQVDPAEPIYAQANLGGAVKPAGQGGVSAGVVVELTEDMPVYRLWQDPPPPGAAYNNRIGGWWSFDKPYGSREGYRRAYEICGQWNALNMVASCKLTKGAVVVVGPGQSVSPYTCNDASGHESYEANDSDWQIYVDSAYKNPALVCPPQSADYVDDPSEISRPVAAPTKAK